jgi:hypothetical protein
VRIVGSPQNDVRGLDLRVRLSHDGCLLPARVIRATSRFEEFRSRPGPWRVLATPRINSRGEEGPVTLEVHSITAAE